MLVFLAPLLAWGSRNLPYLLLGGALIGFLAVVRHSGETAEKLTECRRQHAADMSLIENQNHNIEQLQLDMVAKAAEQESRVGAAFEAGKKAQSAAVLTAAGLLKGPAQPAPKGVSNCDWYSRWAAGERKKLEW